MAEDKKPEFIGIVEVEEYPPITREDLSNIDKWITAANMMIEAKLRTPWSDSERATFKKLDQLKRKVEG